MSSYRPLGETCSAALPVKLWTWWDCSRFEEIDMLLPYTSGSGLGKTQLLSWYFQMLQGSTGPREERVYEVC